MESRNLIVEHSGGVSRVVINRPPMNAVSPDLLEELLAAFGELAARQETRCILLKGTGERAFSAGADLKVASDGGKTPTRFRDLGKALLDTIETLPKPVVAAIKGWCIGGGFAIAMACDVRVASTTAKFRTADAYVGVVPSWGMSLTRLVHYIGRNHTMDMLMLGDDIDADAAFQLGLLTSVTPDDRFDAEVERVLERLASGSPIVFRAIKDAVRAQYWDSPAAARLSELRWSEISSASEDYKEGRRAFEEKRAPRYTGT
jgi:enoyl-CoA hydratase/carnithine racemase